MVFQSGMDVKALANQVPSLYAESSNGRVAPRFYIRGLGNSDFDLAASQPVSIIMDGVVMENVVLKSAPLYDMANVEIARGPQGTLFGRNTTAGIISFNSVRPTQAESARWPPPMSKAPTASVSPTRCPSASRACGNTATTISGTPSPASKARWAAMKSGPAASSCSGNRRRTSTPC